MATGTDLGGTWNTTAGNKTVVATPAVGDLIVVVHGISNWVSGDDSVITDNNADGLGTYHRIGTAAAPLSNGGGTAGALWISVRNAKIGSATSTTFTATNTGDTGGGMTVIAFSGMTHAGSLAVRQTIGESSATETPTTITFPYTTLTGNPIVLGVLGEDNPAGVTPPTGFTEADDTGWATPTTGIEVCWDDSGNTATLFSWSNGALVDHNEVGIELDASATPSIASYTPVLSTRTFARRSTALTAMALAFVPVIEAAAAETTARGTQGGDPPVSTRVIQYPSLAAPVIVPAEAGETITLDKWAPNYPQPIRLRSAPPGGCVGPIHVPDVTDPVPARSWAPTYPDRVPAPPRVPGGASVVPLGFDSDAAPAPTQWAPVYPDRVPGRPRRVASPFVAQPVEPLTEAPAVPAQWTPVYPDRVLDKPRIVRSQLVEPLAVAPPEYWQPIYPDRVPARSRAPLSHVTEPLAVAPPATFTPFYPDRIARRPFILWPAAVEPIDSSTPVVVPPDVGAITVVGRHQPTIAVVGRYAVADVVGRYTPTVNLVGRHDTPITLVGRYHSTITIVGEFEE